MKKILIVDDSLSSRELVRAALEGSECMVDEAVDGQDAIARIHTNPPDLVLMDIQMPVMDGYQALREIRANPTVASLPVIAITAFAMLEDRQKAFSAGFDGYLAKPINISALRMQIDHLTAGPKH